MEKKITLFKREDRYVLYGEDGAKIASSAPNPFKKLSKENCDEIFGIVNVDKLAENKYGKGIYEIEQVDAYVEGFNKAIELNKDKLFTLEQLKTAMDMARIMDEEKFIHTGEYIYSYIQKIIIPTEIEVEIEMYKDGDIRTYKHDPNIKFQHSILLDGEEPRLDKNNCLILKKYYE
jgi:hypothetical protein